MRREGKVFNCPRVFKSCFYAYVLSCFEYCTPVWTSSTEAQLGLLDSLFAVRKGYLRVSFVVWGTERMSVSGVFSIRFITERTLYE